VGPALNDQAKLYNAVTDTGASGKGHLNPEYLRSVLTQGGRIVCGDANSVMPAWLDPKGPLNYREVEDIIKFITASKDTKFVYQPLHVLPPETIPPPVDVEGWRDPAYSPPPMRRRCPLAGALLRRQLPHARPDHQSGHRRRPSRDRDRGLHSFSGLTSRRVSDQPDRRHRRQTVEFHIINNTPSLTTSTSAARPSCRLRPGKRPARVATFTDGTMTFTWTSRERADQPQFACTVLATTR
jgi:hypothetical protein